MPKSLVYALHGFLGCAKDWDQIRQHLNSEIEFRAEDLFKKNQEPFANISAVKNFKGQKIFLGYSLGGRMGLKFLKEQPNLFDHFIFVSTNSGLTQNLKTERESRKLSDRNWANKITENNWNEFITEWNTQDVFKNSRQEPTRDLVDYDLTKLREVLTDWSLGEQEDFSTLIQKYKNKITWVVGNRDEKFVALANALVEKKALNQFSKIEAGHRVWLDNPQDLASLIKQTINNLLV